MPEKPTLIGGGGEILEVPISPPLLNTTKPLKWLNISGAFSLLGFGLGQFSGLAQQPSITHKDLVMRYPLPRLVARLSRRCLLKQCGGLRRRHSRRYSVRRSAHVPAAFGSG